MATFVGSYENKVDAKGRVSVPSRYRAAIDKGAYPGIVIAPSFETGALDACDYERITDVAAALDDPDLYSPEQRLQAEQILAMSIELPFDDNGRVLIPRELLDHAGIDGKALFAGVGPTFQIWNPKQHAEHKARAMQSVQAAGASLRRLPKTKTVAS